MTTNSVLSAIVPEVLIGKNYVTWGVCMQNYLLSQDLWDIIEMESTPKGLDWRKKNASALHALQISCESKFLYEIVGYETAKEAWDFLAKKYSPQLQGDCGELASSSSVEEIEPVGQPSHRFNSAQEAKMLLDSIKEADEKKARTNESQTDLMRVCKVPPILRIEKFKTCYEPSVVSIGPHYHKCDPRLQEVEELKPLIANQFVELVTDCNDIVIFFGWFENNFHEAANELVKGLYDGNVTKDIDKEKFKWMMFLDGCFILHFIFCIQFNMVESMGLKNHLIALVQQDLFLVENQLPFEVLMMLMKLSGPGKELMNLLEEFTEEMNTCGRPIWMRNQEVRIKDPQMYRGHHLLDILWIKQVGNYEELEFNIPVELSNKKKNHIKRHLFHGVKELTAAGIHLRPKSFGSLRDIKFRSHGIWGTLTLPRMTIERSTRQMFFNLIAHEACMDNRQKFGFTSYICFLDLLIDHAEDVKALRTAGILVNYLESDEEVAELFNEMAFDLLPEVDTYRKVKFEIQRYLGDKQKVKIASWLAEVRRDHFKSPWTTIALLAGIIVISLAIVQTIFTIFPRS